MEPSLDSLPPLIDRNGYDLCSDGKYRDNTGPGFQAALALIAKLDREIRVEKDVQWALGELKSKKAVGAVG